MPISDCNVAIGNKHTGTRYDRKIVGQLISSPLKQPYRPRKR